MRRTSPYGKDIRAKAIKFLKEGVLQIEIAKRLDLAQKTVSGWAKRYREEGHLEQRKRPGRAPRLNEEKLKEYLDKNPDSTLKSIGHAFDMGIGGARYWLIKYNYRNKKKNLDFKKPTPLNERYSWTKQAR